MFDGHFNMDTGVQNLSEFGMLKKWNYKDTTKFFKSPCNVVEGSAGEFWPPYREKDEITLFSGDLCRSVGFRRRKETRAAHPIADYFRLRANVCGKLCLAEPWTILIPMFPH